MKNEVRYSVKWLVPTGYKNLTEEYEEGCFKTFEEASDFDVKLMEAAKLLKININSAILEYTDKGVKTYL